MRGMCTLWEEMGVCETLPVRAAGACAGGVAGLAKVGRVDGGVHQFARALMPEHGLILVKVGRCRRVDGGGGHQFARALMPEHGLIRIRPALERVEPTRLCERQPAGLGLR